LSLTQACQHTKSSYTQMTIPGLVVRMIAFCISAAQTKGWADKKQELFSLNGASVEL